MVYANLRHSAAVRLAGLHRGITRRPPFTPAAAPWYPLAGPAVAGRREGALPMSRCRWFVAPSFWIAAALLAHAARAEDAVIVNITGPLAGRVGDRVTYDVELINNSGRNLEKLRVVDYFDAGFHHDASKSPIEQKGTIDLPANTKRWVKLEFLLDEPGRQCHRVEILDQQHTFMGGATECCQVAPNPAFVPPQPPAATGPAAPAAVPAPVAVPPLAAAPLATATAAAAPPPAVPLVPPAAPAIALDLTGPVDAVSGAVTEYVATVRNTGNAASAPAVLEFSWDDGLSPQEASEGYSLAGSRVSWNLPAIAPGKIEKRQINLRAQSPAGSFADSPAARACVRAALTTAGIGPIGDQECLQIRATTPRPRLRTPSEAGLRLSLSDLDDPVRVGDSTTLVCTVFNDGAAPSGPLNLVIDLPRGARMLGDARVRVDDGRVLFDPIDLGPGRQQSFEITYKLQEPGKAKAVATVSGANLDGRLDRSCPTEFFGP